MPRDVSLSDSNCWNGGHEWVNINMLAFSGTIILMYRVCTYLHIYLMHGNVIFKLLEIADRFGISNGVMRREGREGRRKREGKGGSCYDLN